jgi:hypothetical protein
MTTIITHADAALARTQEAVAAEDRGDWAAAARDWALAAEQYANAAWGKETEEAAEQRAFARIARDKSIAACQKRDAKEAGTRIRIEGRIGGWQ